MNTPHAQVENTRGRPRTWPWIAGVAGAFVVGALAAGWSLEGRIPARWIPDWSTPTTPRTGGPTSAPGPAGMPSGAAASTAGGTSAGGPASAAGGRGDPAARVQPVTVGVVQQRDIRVVVQAIGTIAAARTTVVRTRVDGELKALHVQEGQPVRAGQLLAEIDPRPFQVALAQAQGVLMRDQALLDSARRDAARFRELLGKDGIARQQVEQQEALVAQIQGTVQADQAQVDNASLQLSYTKLTAPIPGVAGLKQVDVGNLVRASDVGGVTTINEMRPVFVVFSVPEQHLARIRQQMSRREPLPVEAWDREQKKRLAAGTVSTIDNAIDPATATVRLKARFENADGGLYPNQFVNVRLQLERLAGTLAVPAASLMRSAQGSYVFAVDGEGRVGIRGVIADTADGDWVAVRGDLKAGDRVVTDGTDRLRDGTRVNVIERASGPRSAGAGAAPAAGAGTATTQGTASAASPNAPGGGTGAATATGATGAATSTAAGATPAGSTGVPSAPAGVASSRSAAPTAASRDAPPVVRASGDGDGGPRPAWVDRLPPDDADKVMKLTPEKRQAYLLKHLEERSRREADALAGPNPPDWAKRLSPEAKERLLALTPEERRAWLYKRMLDRAQQQ